jgi:glycine oxidase
LTARAGRTIWEDALTVEEAAKLDPGVPGVAGELNRRPDIVVVGGGMVGLATAVICAQAGLGHVMVVEHRSLGAGASGGAAGLLVPDAHHGSDPAPFVAVGRAGLSAWRRLDSTCPGGVGLLPLEWLGLGPFPPGGGSDLPPTAHRLTAEEVHRLIPDLVAPCPAVVIGGQGRVNPLRALARLADQLVACEGSIVSGVEVLDVSLQGDRVVNVATSAGDLSPGAVVFATGGPPELPHLPLKLNGELIKGHLLATEQADVKLPGSVAPLGTGLEDGRILAGGTLDVDDSTPRVRTDVVNEIKSGLDDAIPLIRGVAISHSWCCFRPVLADRLPVIDRIPGLVNAWVTCGHFRTGILMAPASGDLMAQWIAEDDAPPNAYPFRIQRPSLRGSGSTEESR